MKIMSLQISPTNQCRHFFVQKATSKLHISMEFQEKTNEIAPYGFNQVQANLVTSVKSTIPRKVCVIDSGYQFDHPDLQKDNVGGKCFDSDGNDCGEEWKEDGRTDNDLCPGDHGKTILL